MIEASGLAYTHLRDSLYAEAVATAMAIPALLAGHKPENSGQGRVPIVSRDDCVATAVGVLTQDGHANRAYDVTGPELWTLPGAMALVSEMAGKPIDVESSMTKRCSPTSIRSASRARRRTSCPTARSRGRAKAW
jgi:NAD(P)H dehydrogenase (quinone)